jgi:hypothetical protein
VNVQPSDVDLSRVEIDFAHIRRDRIEFERSGRTTTIDKRSQLACPPFATDKRTWSRAVELFIQGRELGQLRGTPFLVVTQLYRQLGGDFR